MKTAIIYYSRHHGNTKKLLDALAAQGEVDLFDVTGDREPDLLPYDLIGFASGIYYSSFHDSVLQFAGRNLPCGKAVFLIYTYGVKRNNYTNAISQVARAKDSRIVGEYGCRGFDTYGPLSRIGGIAKGRPNDRDIARAVRFFEELGKTATHCTER